MLDLSGSLVALVTPLDANGAIHGDDVEFLVGRALDDGASGVLVSGSTGEGTLLTPEQRVELTRRARHAIDGRGSAPSDHRSPTPILLAGACGARVPALDEDVASLAAAGADAVLVLAPHTYPLRSAELVDLHVGVAQRAPVPTLVYHIPQLTGSSLTPEDVGHLASHRNIVGMKDSSPDADRRARFAAVAAGIEDFALFTGHAPTLRVALEAGVSGSITAIANLRQRQVVALHAAVAAGDDVEAERLQGALVRAGDGAAEVGAGVAAVMKAALQLEGTITERWCVPPLHSVPPARLDHVRTVLMR